MTSLAHPAAPVLPGLDDYGRFAWNIARGTAVWSDSVYRLHGYEPGQVAATSALAFQHKHPDDLYACVDALHAGMVEDRLIVHEHRLVDARGEIRPVVLIGRPVRDGRGRVRHLRGFLLPADVQTGTGGSTPLLGAGSLTPVLMTAFGVSRPAARAVLRARRPLTARRTTQHDLGRGGSRASSDLRGTLEDSMFPLDHLTLEPVDLAA